MDIEPLTPNQSKFHTCKFRSELPITKTIKRCSCRGGDYQLTAFYCNERQIFEVNEDTCQNCEVYQSK
jgi:hypothetical protein